MVQKMINFAGVVKENIKEHNPNWPQIPDHPYRILIIGILINKRENTGLKHLNNSEYTNDMDNIYKNIEKKCKMLIVFDDMIPDMFSNKKFNKSKLFIRGRKLNIALVFITQSYFGVPKNIMQTNENFNKLHLIKHHILTLKTL